MLRTTGSTSTISGNNDAYLHIPLFGCSLRCTKGTQSTIRQAGCGIVSMVLAPSPTNTVCLGRCAPCGLRCIPKFWISAAIECASGSRCCVLHPPSLTRKLSRPPRRRMGGAAIDAELEQSSQGKFTERKFLSVLITSRWNLPAQYVSGTPRIWKNIRSPQSRSLVLIRACLPSTARRATSSAPWCCRNIRQYGRS